MEVTASKPGAAPVSLQRWLDRVGAALLAPALAMRVSDTPKGQGRAAGDIALLLLLTTIAVETELVLRVGWMVRYGDVAGSLTVLLSGARDLLAMPVVVLLAGSVLLTIAAGGRRRPADDFDLSCVALTPLVVLELVHGLLLILGLDVHQVLIYVGYTWFAALLLVALRQTRRRQGKAS